MKLSEVKLNKDEFAILRGLPLFAEKTSDAKIMLDRINECLIAMDALRPIGEKITKALKEADPNLLLKKQINKLKKIIQTYDDAIHKLIENKEFGKAMSLLNTKQVYCTKLEEALNGTLKNH